MSPYIRLRRKKLNIHVFLCVHMYNRRALELKCLDSADRRTVFQLQHGAGGDEHNSLTARSRADHVTSLKTVRSSRISSRLSHGATFYAIGRSYHVHYIPSIPLPPSRHYSMTFDLIDTARTLNLYGLLQTYKHYITVCMH